MDGTNSFEKGSNDSEDMELRRRNLGSIIAYGIVDGILTTDNPSPLNQLTGLDQICFFYSEGLGCSPSVFKNIVLEEYREIRFFDGDDNWDEDYEDEEGNEDEDYDEYNDEQNKEDESATNRHFALGLRLNVLTDDNPSELNGLTGLEQVISFVYGTIRRDEIKRIKNEIMVEEMKLYFSGGYHVPNGIYGFDIAKGLMDDGSSDPS